MICSSSSPPIRRRPGEGRGPRGFTLVELLAVILILAFLIALLLPALNGALRTARNAAVGGEINQLAQALASFKAKYGDYPPSRIYLAENGDLCGQREPSTRRSHPATSPTPNSRSGRSRHSASSSPGSSSTPRAGPSSTGSNFTVGTTSTATAVIGRSLHPAGPRVPGLLPGRHSACRILQSTATSTTSA